MTMKLLVQSLAHNDGCEIALNDVEAQRRVWYMSCSAIDQYAYLGVCLPELATIPEMPSPLSDACNAEV